MSTQVSILSRLTELPVGGPVRKGGARRRLFGEQIARDVWQMADAQNGEGGGNIVEF